MDRCCSRMIEALTKKCSRHKDRFECPDTLIVEGDDGDLGIHLPETGQAYFKISFCPWCGKNVYEHAVLEEAKLWHFTKPIPGSSKDYDRAHEASNEELSKTIRALNRSESKTQDHVIRKPSG